MLTANILDRIAYLMDNTELNRTLRKYALDGIWEAFEPINTTNQDVSNTTVLKIRKNF